MFVTRSEDRSMAEDWYADVRKYAPGADPNVVAAIVRYCGIALQNRDSSLVAFSDAAETDRVRENYLKKKLGLTSSDAELDQAIADVGVTMKADRTKNRVTVYYLLAERFRKLSLFGGVDTVAAAAAARPVDLHTSTVAVGAGAAAAAATASNFAARPAAAAAAAPSSGLMRWLPWLIGLLLLLLLLWWLFGRGPKPAPPPPVEAPAAATAPVAEPAAPVAAAPAIVAGLPQNVYFDTGSAAVSADGTKAITAALDEIKKDAGAKIAITGYTDKTGDQKANEELAKNRAKAVRDALTAAGVPVANIEMRPPAFVEVGANTTAGDAEARRVEISKR
jgi:outer membrane protein OmpA-like peptidoglycan-associated protein